MIAGLSTFDVINEVACLNDPSSFFLRELPFKAHALGPTKTPWRYSTLLFEWLTNHINDFDVLIIHGLWQYHTFATYKAFKSLKNDRIKLFVMPHGMLDPYFQRAKGRKIKAVRNWVFWKLVEKNVINGSTGMLFTCESEMNLASQTFTGYHPKTRHVVGLGVETPPAFNEGMKIALERILGYSVSDFLLFLGRIDEKKGVDLLVKAYLKLSEEKVQLPTLVIAGPGLDSKFGTDIITLVGGYKNIIFPGMLTGDAKWGAFYGAEAFVLPSHQENFGIAVVEALACTTPVLISDQVNIWKEIEMGKAGVIGADTEEGTYSMLKNWIEKTDKEKKDMRIFAKDTFNACFSVKKAADRLFEVIK
ncbi:glycosyltransferase [Pedobacter sp. MC2016-14]|uniref:glycosyltransferase n=1 Tax=Pedobacter sp. MC2016-14 TaxID=2897327 RepID=UPI001E33FB58|nr:glycosyltransferase [Pedobacter sp. MC2016-14]MCD0486858.1 glycosyltransferase [Pedobacter sp. MC2016-14]